MVLMRMLAFTPAAGAAQTVPPDPVSVRAAAPTASPPGLKKKLIDGDWNALVQRLPLAGMERMLAHNCEFVGWQEGRIELRVPHAQRHLNDRAYQGRLKLALEQHLGTRISLEISVGPSNGNTIAEIQERENQQRLNTAAAAIDSDPFVRDLVENLGARVLSSTIKPVQ
jgi:DNA polymerase-3 subunit gamma/tau